ncbi:MAG: hypothetical protein JW801_05255 [Bacteroidales bacterium]|nr:hypothetical protein [Bacteroidales bacterium]
MADKTSGKLQQEGEELPFSTPEGYFDMLNVKINSRIRQTEAEETRSRHSGRTVQLAWMSGIAATLIGFIVVLPLFFDEKEQALPAQEEIAEVLHQEIYDLDSYDLEFALLDREVDTDLEMTSYEDEVIQYLLEEDIELEMIVNEL